MKIFITGAKGSGKSTLVNFLIKEFNLKTTGFKTLPLCEKGKRIGFYFHSMIAITDNDQRFSRQLSTINETIPGVFNDLGVRCLLASQGKDYIIMDEIGYLEHDEKDYLQHLEQTIDLNPNIIGVLRKCTIEYIQKIKEKKDILLIDIDELSFEQAKRILLIKMKDEAIYEKNT